METFKYKNLGLVIFLFLFSQPSLALNPSKKLDHFPIKNFKIENGLPQNFVKSVLQTSKAYIWFGTEEGLIRFNSQTFKTYDRKTFPKLNSHYVSCLYEDLSSETLWVGGIKGFFKINLKTNELTIPNSPLNNLKIYKFKKIDNTLFALSQKGAFKLYKDKFEIQKGTENHKIYDAEKLDNNKIAFGSNQGLLIYEINKNKILKQFLKINRIYSLQILNDKLLIATFNNGIWSINKTEMADPKAFLKNLSKVKKLYLDSNKALWIASKQGLFRYFNKRIQKFSKPNPLSFSNILDITEDREGNIWLGTGKNGVFQIQNGSVITWDKGDGLQGETVFSVAKSSLGQLIVGFEKTGPSIEKSKNTNIISHRDLKQLTSILSLNNKIYLASYENGLFLLNNDKLSKIETGLNQITALFFYDNQVLAGTSEKGVYFQNQDSWDSFSHHLRGLSIHHLSQDSKNRLWVATDNGAFVFQGKKLKSHYSYKKGLSNNLVSWVLHGKNDRVWLSTLGGLNFIKNSKIKVFDERHGLFSSSLFSILKDHKNRLWFSSNRGLFYINSKELLSKGKTQSKIFSVQDGLKSPEFMGAYQNVAYKDSKNNHLYFASTKGLVMVDAKNLYENKTLPLLNFEKLKINGQEQVIEANKILKPGLKSFELTFSNLSFTQPEKNKSKFRLMGFQKEWQPTDKNGKIKFTNLPPGNYSLEIIGSNNHGKWAKKPLKLDFYLSPFFHQTPWFYVLIFFLSFSLFFLIYFFRVKQLQKRQFELLAINKMLEEKDRAKTLFFHNTSHELRTPLNGILGYLGLIKNGRFGEVSDEINEQIKKVETLSLGLLDQVNTILDLANSKKGELRANNQDFDLRSLFKNLETLSIGIALKYQNKHYKIISNLNQETAQIFRGDEEKLLSIARNLLGNAFKFSKPGKKNHVELTLTRNSDELSIEVSDTGIGIKPEDKDRIFHEFSQVQTETSRSYEGTGLGLSIVQNNTLLLNGKITLESSLGEGSKFSIIIPEYKLEPTATRISPESPMESKLLEEIGLDQTSSITLRARKKVNFLEKHNQNYNVLVVDDNPTNLEVISEILKLKGFKVTEASGGQEAIDYLTKNSASLVLLDIMMPEVSGEDVLEFIRKNSNQKALPVILLTARASEEDKIFGLSLGADDYLAKPVNTEELLVRVSGLIFRSQLTKDLASAQEIIISQEKLTILGDLLSEVSHEIRNLQSGASSTFTHYKGKYRDLLSFLEIEQLNWADFIEGFFKEKLPFSKFNSRRSKWRNISNDDESSKTQFNNFKKNILSTDLPDETLEKYLLQIKEVDPNKMTVVNNILELTNNFFNLSKNAQKTIKLMNNILSFSRVKNQQEANIITVSDVALNLLEKRIYILQCQVDLNVSKMEMVKANPSDLEQVLINIIGNALDSLEENNTEEPSLKIYSNPVNDSRINLVVEDNGKGIPEKMAKRVFEKNFSTKGEKGNGIGLFVCQKLIQKSNGIISVESKPGKTQFIIELEKA